MGIASLNSSYGPEIIPSSEQINVGKFATGEMRSNKCRLPRVLDFTVGQKVFHTTFVYDGNASREVSVHYTCKI